MTMSSARRCVGLALVAVLVAACTDSDGDADTSDTEPDLTANVVTLPPAPAATPLPTATTRSTVEPTSAADPNDRTVIVDLTGELRDAGGSLDLGDASVVDFAGVPLTDIAISPSGDRIASNRGTEICFIETAIGTSTPDEACAEFGAGIGDGSMNWSPDESLVAFNHDLFRSQEEPDIVVLDTTNFEFEVVTDDGSDDVELGAVDITPFFDEEGGLHFFRVEDGPSVQLMNVEGPTATPVDGLRLAPFTTRAVRDPVTGGIAITLPQSDGATAIEWLDMAGPATSRVTGPARDAVLLDISEVRAGRALTVPFASVPDAGPLAVLVDLERSVPTHVIPRDIDADRSVTGAGLSSDGAAVVLIIEHRGDPSGHQLVIAPVGDDGVLGPFGVAATGPEFAPNDADKTIRPHGLGVRNEVEWVNARMIYGLGPDRIVTLDVIGSP